MDREQQVEKLLEQPYYVIDFLPRHNLRYSDYDKSIYYEKDVIEHKRLFEKDIADRQKELSEFLDRANIRVEWINKCEQEKRYSISGSMVGPGIEHGYLEDIIVHSSYQGKGIGNALVKRLLQEAELRGISIVTVTFEEANCNFYEKCGFSSCPGGVWRKNE